jgi:hypothetical protein
MEGKASNFEEDLKNFKFKTTKEHERILIRLFDKNHTTEESGDKTIFCPLFMRNICRGCCKEGYARCFDTVPYFCSETLSVLQREIIECKGTAFIEAVCENCQGSNREDENEYNHLEFYNLEQEIDNRRAIRYARKRKHRRRDKTVALRGYRSGARQSFKRQTNKRLKKLPLDIVFAKSTTYRRVFDYWWELD